jgi:signal transduction histidine kinase
MNLRRRSRVIYFLFLLAALLVITLGISVIEKQAIEKQIEHLVPEFRRSLVQGDNRAVREIIRNTLRYPVLGLEVKRFDGIVVDSQSSNDEVSMVNFKLSYPLKILRTESEIGVVKATYTLDQSLRNGVLIWFIFLLISAPLFAQFLRIQQKIETLNTENAKANAIARTTQMLAHDVRKPFALFKMTIERIKSAATTEQVLQALQEALPEVERSMGSVDGIIMDVMNVGGDFSLVLKPVRLGQIIEEVTDEVSRLYPQRSLSIQSNLSPHLWIQGDLTRLPRVFLNILSNAIEAVESKEVRLWIAAHAVEPDSNTGNRMVEILLGNAGSFIAPESRERIFDLFFTAGKSGGTGLGLAIVKKIISQHGGTVVCSSEKSAAFPEGKVEFVFQLQAASPVEESLPQPSNTVQSRQGLPEAAQSSKGNMQSSLKATPNIPGATQHAREATHAAPKPRVVFLDDSPLARWVWEAKLKPHTEIRCFEGPRELREAIESCGIELSGVHTIITDHYFAPDERLTGLDVARELRSGGFTGRILLASNGAFSPAELVGLVDKVVDKNPVEWEKLNTAETE